MSRSSKIHSIRVPPPVRGSMAITYIGGGIGMFAGFCAEVGWHGNMLWMTGGALVGGVVGGACDFSIYRYRCYRRKQSIARAQPKT